VTAAAGNHHPGMRYRREIDGLRALAVLPVIAFHAGFALFSGGFVGVDVFFVISGYLITSIILVEREKGRFSLAGFYERRARRILPALFVVMLACLPAAWLLLLPGDMRDFAKSLVAVPVFSSNVLFWKEAGYFDSGAELKPLLHTWSLAVEEQYYLFFPLLLLAGWRFGKKQLACALAVLALVSLLAAEWGTRNFPSAAFYLLPTRGWELLVGALLAFHLLAQPEGSNTPRPLREAGSLAGVACIAAAIFLFDSETPFPGAYALLPVLGTALVILFADHTTHAGKWLGHRLLVGVGLISYSAYLWHQPLFAFARHRSLGEPATATLLLLCALTVLLAWLTWKFVEMPFRDRSKTSAKTIFIAAATGAVLFIALGITGWQQGGFSARFPAFVQKMDLTRKEFRRVQKNCSATPAVAGAPTCTLGNAGNLTGVMLGDSHAEALADALGEKLAEKNLGMRLLSATGCAPIAGVQRREYPGCAAHNDNAHAFVLASQQIHRVVLMARWTLALEESRYDNGEGGVEGGESVHLDATPGISAEGGAVAQDGTAASSGTDARFRRVAAQLVTTVHTLLAAGKQVVLVYPVPEAGWNVPDRLAKLYLRNGVIRPGDASTAYAAFVARTARTRAVLDSIGEHPALLRIYPEKFLCNAQLPGRCMPAQDCWRRRSWSG